MEADCSFLITTAVVLMPSGDFQLCVQANDQVSAQSWEVYQYGLSSTPVQTGTSPNMCWTLDGSDPHIFILHSVDGGGNPCTRSIRIVSDELCPEGIVQADVNNCNLETVVSIDDSNISVPYVITFGDGSLAQESSASEITYTYGQSGTYDICLTYLAPGYEAGYITCCYSVEIALPQECECPENFVEVVSVEPCTWSANLFFEPSFADLPIEVDFGDGTKEIVDDNLFTHVFPGPGNYNLCYTKEVFPGNTITCCQQVNIPGCCLDASFTLAPDYENGWASCYNPGYIITPTACLSPIIELTHIWELSDGTVYYQPFPPVHTFTNFLNTEGEVCVTHTIICCEESVSETVCFDHFPAAYIGTPGGVTNLDDIIPTTGQTVLEFIQENQDDPSLPLLIDGQLNINVANAFFTGGVWNMGRNSEIVVQGKDGPALPFQARQFRLSGTTIRSAVRLASPLFAACCRWKGIRSEKLTAITLTNAANLMDAEYAIHYPSMSAGFLFPSLHSVDAVFENNFFAIKSVGQHVRFPRFQGNILNGASMDPHVCGCTAVNAIDFRDAGGAALTININDLGFGANEIFNYEKGFSFENTRLIAQGFNIHDLREFDTSPGVPNNPPGQSAIGIDFSWTNPGNSRLEIDRISFTDFEESGALSYAVRDRIFKGLHTLRADASSVGSINTAGIAGGYDLTIHAPATLEGGSSISQNILLTDGSNSLGAGFGITGNFTAQGNLLEIRDNSITVATGGNNPLNGGIILTSKKDLKQSFTIENNNINLALTNGVGIGVNGARGYCVRQNWIGNFSAATGIALSGGGSATVDCNEVLFKPTGVSVMASTQNTYSGNFLSGNVNDMHFTGDCKGVAGSTIRWNQFDLSYQPSLVWDDDAFTGQQLHNSYNSWTGQGNQGGGNVEVQHNASVWSSNLTQSRFRRPFSATVGSVHFPNHSLGMMEQAPNNTITSIPDGFCDSTNGCIAAEVDQGADPKEDYETIVQDTATWNALTEAQQTYLRQGIYGLLLENPDWLNGSSALSGFKALHDGSFVGQSETLRHDWLQLMDDISAHQSTLQPIHDSLSVLADQLQQWFDAIAADPGLEASLQSQMDAAIQQGEVLAAQLQQAEDQLAPAVQATVAQLLAQNTALDGTTQYGWNEKRYNEIALKWLVGAEPDSTAADDLRTIAQTCLPDGGRAVLDARGLCAVWLKEYYDEGNCSSLQLRNGDGAASVNAISPDLRIVPNPADDMVWISLQGAAAEGQQVQVFSMDGRQVFSSILPSVGSMAIPVKDWQGGLYIVKITGDGTAIARKFMVQHP